MYLIFILNRPSSLITEFKVATRMFLRRYDQKFRHCLNELISPGTGESGAAITPSRGKQCVSPIYVIAAIKLQFV